MRLCSRKEGGRRNTARQSERAALCDVSGEFLRQENVKNVRIKRKSIDVSTTAMLSLCPFGAVSATDPGLFLDSVIY